MTDRATFAVEWVHPANGMNRQRRFMMRVCSLTVGCIYLELDGFRIVKYVQADRPVPATLFTTLDEAKAALLKALGGTPC